MLIRVKMSESGLSTQTVLIIANLIVTAIVAIITTMRCRYKCGNSMCTCKPKTADYSPGSVDENQPVLPKGAVAVVIGDSPGNNKS